MSVIITYTLIILSSNLASLSPLIMSLIVDWTNSWMQPATHVSHCKLVMHDGISLINLASEVELTGVLDLIEPTSIVLDLVPIEILERILVNLLRVFAYARHILLSHYGNSNFLRRFIYNWSCYESRDGLIEELNWRHNNWSFLDRLKSDRRLFELNDSWLDRFSLSEDFIKLRLKSILLLEIVNDRVVESLNHLHGVGFKFSRFD